MSEPVRDDADRSRQSGNLVRELLQRRYLLKDQHGRPTETVDQMFERVAHAIAAVEATHGADSSENETTAGQFKALVARSTFLPNSPTLMNAGRPNGLLMPPTIQRSCTTIAPTGSISILAACSAGIEPIYSLAHRRRALDGREFVEVHPLLARLGSRDGWLTAQVRNALLEGIPPTEISAIPGRVAETLVTAHQVSPDWHVRIQAAFQEHVDSAVSKTVNLPADATVSDVDRAFRLAFELGCKGTTVYRDGSRHGQTLSPAHTPATVTRVTSVPRPRARMTTGQTLKFRMGLGRSRSDHAVRGVSSLPRFGRGAATHQRRSMKSSCLSFGTTLA